MKLKQKLKKKKERIMMMVMVVVVMMMMMMVGGKGFSKEGKERNPCEQWHVGGLSERVDMESFAVSDVP